MSRKKCQSITLPSNENTDAARQEIDHFLQALNSYPDRFAHDPCLSFEKHLFSIMTTEPEQHA